MKKTSFLFVGLFAVGSLFTLAACGDDTETTMGTTNGTAGGGMGGEGGTGGGGMGGMGGTGGGAGGMGGAGGGSASSCDTYCAAIAMNCTADNAQYADMASCMGSCSAIPEGKPSDMAGNTVGCRIYHAGAASMDAALHCVHAGPGGAGACGTNCESFCSIATATCPKEHPDNATCMTTCMGFPGMMEKYDASDSAGDTLACRLYHLTVASSSDANKATHCPHTVGANNPVCN